MKKKSSAPLMVVNLAALFSVAGFVVDITKNAFTLPSAIECFMVVLVAISCDFLEILSNRILFAVTAAAYTAVAIVHIFVLNGMHHLTAASLAMDICIIILGIVSLIAGIKFNKSDK